MTQPRKCLVVAVIAAVALVVAACGGGGGPKVEPPEPTPVDLSGVTPGYTVASGTVEIEAGATEVVGDLAFSCAAGGADCTVTVDVDRKVTRATDGGEVTASNSPAYQARVTLAQQRTDVGNAISAAAAAVGSLTETSTDTEVTAAQKAIDAARAALEAATALPASEALALSRKIAETETDLEAARAAIADRNTRDRQAEQRRTVTEAISVAATAVGGLTDTSTDAEVAAVQVAIDAAKTALEAATALPASEALALSRRIAETEASLSAARMAIADRKTADRQRATVAAAIDAAKTAVDGLTETSTDTEVALAQAAIDAAKAALSGATALSQEEKSALGGQIAGAETALAAARTAIADRKTANQQRATVTAAIAAARTAVDGLTETSTDAEVAAAQGGIDSAKKVLAAAAKLSVSDVAALSGLIAAAETSLAAVKQRIALRRAKDIAEKVAMLYGEASGATGDATAAFDKATQAGKDADEYAGMLDALSVDGNSGVASANAGKVLEAEAAAKQAVIDAEAAKARAEKAKTDAEALPADNTDRAGLIAALEAAVAHADAQIVAAKAIRDGSALSADVQAVTGTDAKNPKTAADIGTGVANAIDAALADNGGDPTRVTFTTSVGSLTLPATVSATVGKVVKFDDARGRTFAEIVGEANLVDRRIASGGSATKAVKAMSVAGMKLTDVFADGSIPSDIGNAGDGAQYDNTGAGSNYKAVAGVIFCSGSDCKVEGTGAARTLAGSWYFTPDEPDRSYVANTATAADDYTPELLYSTYGHWLTDDGSGNVTVNVFSVAGAVDTPTDFALGVVAGEPSTATYSGAAAGMSVHETFDVNGNRTSIGSGAFTADVRLTAKFGSSPTLAGTVSNFQGSAVDSGWSVALSEQAFNTGSFAGGTTNDNAADTNEGTWTATAYGGDSTKRPAGVYGVFDAYFADGAVAGAYAAQ